MRLSALLALSTRDTRQGSLPRPLAVSRSLRPVADQGRGPGTDRQLYIERLCQGRTRPAVYAARAFEVSLAGYVFCVASHPKVATNDIAQRPHRLTIPENARSRTCSATVRSAIARSPPGSASPGARCSGSPSRVLAAPWPKPMDPLAKSDGHNAPRLLGEPDIARLCGPVTIDRPLPGLGRRFAMIWPGSCIF